MTVKRCLLTGGTGFVGANLTRRLLAEGHEVHLLVRPKHESWRITDVRDQIELHVAELTDAPRVESVLHALQPDWIFHLATHGAYPDQVDVAEITQTNIFGTLHLVQAALNVGFEALVNTGSSSEYGYKDHPASETDVLVPNSYYAVAKAWATHFCSYTARSHDIRIPTLRLYSVYGPFEAPNRLMPTLVVHGLRGTLPPLAQPGIARDYVYSEDVNDAYLRAASSPLADPGAVFNVGTGVQTTLRDVVEVARSALRIREEPDWGSMPDRSWDTSIWVADNDRIRRELGWEPVTTLTDGFQHMTDWFGVCPDLAAWYTEQQRLARRS